MSEYNEGDLVEAVKGETVVRGRIRKGAYSPEYQYVGDAAAVSHYQEGGFEVTVIERAKPNLPTEPGVYLPYMYGATTTQVPNVWLLNRSGWLELPNVEGIATRRVDPKKLSVQAERMVRLEAPAVTARKVFERIEERYGENYFHNSNEAWNDVAREFGVSA